MLRYRQFQNIPLCLLERCQQCPIGLFDGLVMGEVEFPDEETAKRYTLPDSFAVKKEVTYDTHFHNSTMSAMHKEEIAQFIQSLSA